MDRLRELDERVYNNAPPKTDVGNSQQKLSEKQLERKKKEFAAAINLGDSSQMSPEKIADHAIRWLEIVDRDQNGTISLQEFHEFF